MIHPGKLFQQLSLAPGNYCGWPDRFSWEGKGEAFRGDVGVVGDRLFYGRGTKCVFLGFCCVDATLMMGVVG